MDKIHRQTDGETMKIKHIRISFEMMAYLFRQGNILHTEVVKNGLSKDARLLYGESDAKDRYFHLYYEDEKGVETIEGQLLKDIPDEWVEFKMIV
jgi:hypothetical protein